jgi:predicted DNA-binding transcriptional regulator AlpA
MSALTTLPATGFVRLPTILLHIPVSRSTWWQMVRDRRAPQPLKLSANVTAWKAEDIHAFIETLSQEGS